MSGCEHLSESVEALTRRLVGERKGQRVGQVGETGGPGLRESRAEGELRRLLGEGGEDLANSLPTAEAANILAKDARYSNDTVVVLLKERSSA